MSNNVWRKGLQYDLGIYTIHTIQMKGSYKKKTPKKQLHLAPEEFRACVAAW